MSRILVIGGYGGFGARLSRQLHEAGHEMLVGGRSEERAKRFCESLPGSRAVPLDRTKDLGRVLADLKPDLMIDAAGPFQGSSYAVPEACIRERASYLDLADARDFVTGIGALDEAARAAGVVVVSGASSLPGLSGAVVRHLANGLDRVDQVEIALSASSRATTTASVVSAILSYVGKPIRLWRGRRWAKGYGWQSLRRQRYEVTGAKPLRRWVALADVPDLDILPERLPGRPSVTFRAGTDVGLHVIFLWLASWPVRWGWLSSLQPKTHWLLPLQRMTSWAAGGRSAMEVAVRGQRDGRGLERKWTIIAEKGEGAQIPPLPAALLAEDFAAGRLPPGARDAEGLFSLDRLEDSFKSLAVRHAITERETSPLYERVMGDRFAALAPAVHAIHQVHGDGGAAGQGRVRRAKTLIGRGICSFMRFPPSGSCPVHVAFAERNGVETWTRDFGGHQFRSVLRQRGSGATERFGPVSFTFDLYSDEGGLRMVLRRWDLLGIPLPLFLAPKISAREWQEGQRFHFDVSVALPLIGPVICYSGWLEPEFAQTERAARKTRTALA